jgi:hypothetical protein
MKESSVKNIEFNPSEWSSTKIKSIDSISGNGILVDGQDGVLILEGEPVQRVSKESGSWIQSEDTNLSPSLLKEPENRETSLLFVCKICDKSLVSDIYSDETGIQETDRKLREASFTGYIEVSKGTISGEHYLIYIDGERSCLSMTKGGNIITGQESYDRAEAHIGLYSIYKIELQDVSLNRKQFESEEEIETTKEYHKEEIQNGDKEDSSEQIEENNDVGKTQEKEPEEDVDRDTENIGSQASQISNSNLARIENKLDKIESEINKLSHIGDTREEKSQEINEYDITDEYDESEIFDNMILSFRYNSFSETLAQCETENQIKDVLENIDIIPQTTASTLSDVADTEVENYILQHERFVAIKWLLEEYFINLMNDSAPNLPGFVFMMQNLEQVSYNDMFGNKLHDAVFYSRDGEVRGVVEFYDEQVDISQIDDAVSRLSSSIDELEEPFCYIGISRNGYHPSIRSYIEEERYKGGIIRGENRNALIKSDDGTEIHVCLFEEHNQNFFVYYPDGKKNE